MKVRKTELKKEESKEAYFSSSSSTVKSEEESVPKKPYFRDAHRKGWRLVIRNLPFKTKKEELQVICSKFGPFTEIVLPKCRDPRYPDSCAGFAFVQFKLKADALKALEGMNFSEVNGRKVAVDWALDKDTYETMHYEENQGKSVTASEKSAKQESKAEDKRMETDGDSSEDFSEEEGDNEGGQSGSDDEQKQSCSENQKRQFGFANGSRKVSKSSKSDLAMSEGRVVFVRNLSYETNDDALKEALEKFGEIKLAIICRYSDSSHSKGTGFIHFASREDADKCIAASDSEPGIFVDDRRIYGHRALPREEAATAEKEHLEKKPKDKRNLYLLRLGVIRPGTATARGMSEGDAQKRARLGLAAREKLRNLHMFVSSTRLVIHNLPPSLTDKNLRSICFLAAGNPDANILECRIWRNRQNVNGKKIAQSKGFGFVSFSQHVDAVNCLRQLNNNPETFSNDKRPIVEFSIENMAALRLKENRLKKSKQKLEPNGKANTDEINRQDVERTKQALATGGQKPLPSRFGPKIRKRDIKGKEKFEKIKGKRNKGIKRKMPIDRPQVSKKPKPSKAKHLTRYLALA